MSSRSRLIHYAALTLTAVVVFGIAAWVALNAIETVPVPPVPPSKADVVFDPKVDIRNHPLFNTLRTLTRGSVAAGVLGRPNPFFNGAGGVEALQEGAAPLARIQEVALGGASAIAIARGAESGILALIQNGAGEYEVRRLRDGEAPVSLGNWSVEGADSAITPVALQEDRSGTVWLLSVGGRIGSMQADGKPLWGSVPLEGIRSSITAAQALMTLDGAGRIWLSDGASVFVGNGLGFQRIELEAQFSAADRQTLGISEGGAAPAAISAPKRLQMLADGRIAVMTERVVAAFPLNLQGTAKVEIPEGEVVAVEPQGAVWSVVRNGGSVARWIRTEESGTQEFRNAVVLPKQSSVSPLLMAGNNGILYALDYLPGASILWNVREGEWVANVLSPEGTQPQDRAERIEIDREGNVWALLAQRGVLRVQSSP